MSLHFPSIFIIHLGGAFNFPHPPSASQAPRPHLLAVTMVHSVPAPSVASSTTALGISDPSGSTSAFQAFHTIVLVSAGSSVVHLASLQQTSTMGLSSGAIAGIVLGVVTGCFMIAGVLIAWHAQEEEDQRGKGGATCCARDLRSHFHLCQSSRYPT
ncbi:hypothetical protein L198_07407 [Cryptococcus wingfieldii CBS 7118]|uniref:Uncharacterized protein n=1 Tax=Cryptococcus wingfieldii CBS 7118 TaxID=1295528 RepID=A0A1E3IBY3_9TREE|nr:hypothetical protein L198_08167 [Cryptococcus wingfieldii CBS 7118]XP_019028657.1 hypothetical protein L198_07407 [Cryptococcus wingfieldii CBS 7118]ODN74981.1 hypothetical protein L198_08167 [Cryptococcus wingfieldii CBS 7118]ODN86114.1 hypothetical protein L198_07407 [Cryptococcus wingfieldii CBS 7118]